MPKVVSRVLASSTSVVMRTSDGLDSGMVWAIKGAVPLVPSLSDRRDVVIAATIEIQRAIGPDLACVVAYGSTLDDDFTDRSDYDLLVILQKATRSSLDSLERLRLTFLTAGVMLDINVQTASDLARRQTSLFWHNNRCEYICRELSLYGFTAFGDNPFDRIAVERTALRNEVVRVLNSLVYQTRKTLINKGSCLVSWHSVIKWCIYGSLYALAFEGIFPPSRLDALAALPSHFVIPSDPSYFLALKRAPETISRADIYAALGFLESLDCEVMNRIGSA
jgi:hypothetical protein